MVVINKATAPLAAELSLVPSFDFPGGRSFRLSSGVAAIVPGPELRPGEPNHFRLELPASSVTTLVFSR